MRDSLRYILLITAIVPATILLGLSLLVSPNVIPFAFRDYKKFLIMISLIFGVIGYLGLWRTLMFNEQKNIKTNIILLCFGLLGFVIFMIIEGRMRFINWILEFKEVGEILLFTWPAVVTIMVLIGELRLYKGHNCNINN